MKKDKKIYFWLSLIFFLIIDQVTKLIVIGKIPEKESIPIINNIFHFTHIKNTGIAFGLFQGNSRFVLILGVFTLLTFIILFFTYKRPSGVIVNLALGLICAGAMGNLIDRIFYGKVIDFLDFRIWPVFNIADASVVIGIILVIVFYIFTNEKVPAKN